MSSRLLLLLLVLGALVLVGCSDDDPITPIDIPDLGYAGSDACAVCHTEKHDQWVNSGHPYKLTPVNGEAPTDQFPAHSMYANDSTNPPNGTSWDDYSYTIGGFGWKMRWIQNDGYIHTPAEGGNQYNFQTESFGNYHAGEVKAYNCGSCHTTGWVGSDDGVAENNQDGMEGFLGTFFAGGVHCENCHGMGNQHALDPEGYAMETDNTSEFCGKCHTRGGDNGISHGGEIIEASGGYIKHHEQFDEWYNSPHNVSYGPGCNDCHDPHASVVFDSEAPGDGVSVTNTCTGCHVDGSHANIQDTTHGYGATCVDCHMPDASKSAVATTLHAGDVSTHIWQINTSVNGKADMFSVDGTSVLIDPEDGASITLDFACYGCHTDSDGNGGGGSVKTLQELHDRAETIHVLVPTIAAK
ncbi:hypothetical protein HOD41_00315 [bacterium]|nr:hypothetical protein [bacterium]